MPGFLLPIGHQFFDDNGNPLSGGKLHAYTAGTSTPRSIYTTEDLNVAHANPAILDAAGRLTAFVEDGISYKFRLLTSADVLVREWDEVAVPDIQAPAAAAEVPVGGMLPYAGSAAPTGYLLCDGAAVSRTTYAALYAVTGTAFGAGNGTTTFNLPDMRGRFPLGVAASGTGATRGGTGGAIDHVHAGPSHTHTVAAHSHTMAHTHTVSRDGWGGALVAGASTSGRLLAGDGAATNLTHAQNNLTSGGSSAANTGTQALTTDAGGTANTGSANPPFCAIHFIIKT